MPDRKLEKSPTLAQIKSDGGVAGAVVRKTAGRAKRPVRVGRTERVPQWASHMAADSPPAGNWRGAPAPVVEVPELVEETE